MTAPVMTKPRRADADERLADDDAGEAPHHHADAHLHVGEALVLRQQRAGERDEAVRQRQAEHDHVVHVDAERADHLRVVAGRLHRRAEVRSGRTDTAAAPTTAATTEREHERRRASRVPTSQPRTCIDSRADQTRIAADSAIDASVRSDSSGRLLLPMTCRLIGVERGHHEDAREQAVDLEARVEHAGRRPRRARRPTNAAAVASERVDARDDQHGGDRAAERDRAVGRDVRELEDPEADEDAERQQREDESDRAARQSAAARRSSSSRIAARSGRSSRRRARTRSRRRLRRRGRRSAGAGRPSGWSASNRPDTVSARSIRPFLIGRNGNAAACRCPAQPAPIGRSVPDGGSPSRRARDDAGRQRDAARERRLRR